MHRSGRHDHTSPGMPHNQATGQAIPITRRSLAQQTRLLIGRSAIVLYMIFMITSQALALPPSSQPSGTASHSSGAAQAISSPTSQPLADVNPRGPSTGANTPRARSPVFEDDTPRRYTGGTEINYGKQILVTLIWLLVLCGGMVLLARYLQGRVGMGGLGGGARSIQVLDRHILGPQRALMIVKVGGKNLLLGMTEQQITTLCELDQEDFTARPSATRLPGRQKANEEPPHGVPSPEALDLAGLFGRRGTSTREEHE